LTTLEFEDFHLKNISISISKNSSQTSCSTALTSSKGKKPDWVRLWKHLKLAAKQQNQAKEWLKIKAYRLKLPIKIIGLVFFFCTKITIN